MSEWRYRHRAWWVMVSVVTGAALAVGILVAVVAWNVETARRPENLGSMPDNLARAAERADARKFSFVVVGDVHSHFHIFDRILDRVGAGEQPAFLVIVGDMVGDYEPALHKSFFHEMSVRRLPYPVLTIPGNHDVWKNSLYTAEDYEADYGPRQYFFLAGDNLFIFLHAAVPYDADHTYLTFLKDVLARERAKAKHAFVFLHMPCRGMGKALDLPDSLDGGEELLALCRQYKVDYCFTGDHHRYFRNVKDGTVYIVTGGAGGKLVTPEGHIHHGIRVTVDGDTISDEVIGPVHYSAADKLLNNTRKFVVRRVWAHLRTVPYAGPAGIALLAVVALVFMISVHRTWARRPDRTGSEGGTDAAPPADDEKPAATDDARPDA